MYDIVVIGGGAAGMLAAISGAEHLREQGNTSPRVLLLEKNEKLGKKLYITGKGRCNLTNASDVEELLKAVTVNYQFLYSSFYGFTNGDIVELLEKNGCPTKVERGNRVFPVSDHASDVISALQKELKCQGVKIRLHCPVQELLLEKSEGEYCCNGVKLVSGETVRAKRTVVATGGCSYPSTGSTGDGYRFAEAGGHHIIPLRPGLVPFVTEEEYPKELQGLSLRNVKLTMRQGKKVFFEEQGEMLFTHFGVSGPLVLSASAYLPEPGKGRQKAVSVTGEIDVKPALSEKQLDERILRDFDGAKNKAFKNALDGLLPKKLIPVVIQMSGISGEKKVHDITREERQGLVQMLKGIPFTVAGVRGFSEAIITKGGVSVKEIDPGTMESRLVKQLHFAGEVLDLDAVTGGYNLQIAWSTGYAAGIGAAR
ncbi:MAG: NAD(P)/FAD-dependent oxidoreductase [Lachnospiraceae bacterium]|nr:NAD(P)/FAD-dependent oxidoreductase [Lachnospiraceae bacterium]